MKNLLINISIILLLLSSCQKDCPFLPTVEEKNTNFSLKLKSGSTTDYLFELIEKIETLVSEGTLSEGTGNSLIAKVENAIRSIQNGNSNAVKGQLNALINQVEGLIDRGDLTPEQGQPLIDGAESEMILADGYFIDPRDGEKYTVVQIGTQLWMAENLAYLPEISVPVQDRADWTQKKYHVYGYMGTNIQEAKLTANYLTYGVLYNWSAAMDGANGSNAVPSGVQGICPPGWHLPSNDEWNALEISIGGSTIAGNKMKEAGTEHWNSPNYGATNESGFTGLPGGYHNYYGTPYMAMGSNGYWWTSTESTEEGPLVDWHAWIHFLYLGPEAFSYDTFKDIGFSVRCIKN